LPERAANLKPEGVQVVEGVGLVSSGLFINRLGSVFAEEVGEFI